MICHKCNGKGKVFVGERRKEFWCVECHNWFHAEMLPNYEICDRCNGTGQIEETNEEWFNRLPLTKKSEFLAKKFQEAIDLHKNCGASMYETVSWWDVWLKSKHIE